MEQLKYGNGILYPFLQTFKKEVITPFFSILQKHMMLNVGQLIFPVKEDMQWRRFQKNHEKKMKLGN